MIINSATRYRRARQILRADPRFRVRNLCDLVPVTVLCDDLQLNYTTLVRRLADPALFTMKNIAALAKVFKMDRQEWFDILNRAVKVSMD
jgi:hypothetical protein